MQFIKKIKLTFLGLVLSILLPLVSIIVIFMGINNKLLVISSTNSTLIEFIVIAVLSLMMTLFASYLLAIRIIRPMEILKASALKIASGNYRDTVLIKSPKELSELSFTLNEMSQELQMSFEDTENISHQEKSYLQRDQLNILLKSKHFSIQAKGLEESKHLVGLVEKERYIYIYSIEETFATAVEASKRKVMLSYILEKFLHKGALLKFFSLFMPSGFIIIDKLHLDKLIIVKHEIHTQALSKKVFSNKNKLFRIKDIEFSMISAEDKV